MSSTTTTTRRDQERELEELRARVAKLESERDKRKRAEDALLEHQELLQSIIEGTDDLIFAKNVEGRYVLMNSSDSKGFGKSPSEVIGLTDRDLFSPEQAERIIETDRQVISSREHLVCEQQYATPASGGRTYLVHKYPRIDRNGKVVGVLGIARDITQGRQTEQMLSGRNRVLEQLATGAPLEAVLCLLVENAEALYPGLLGSVLLLDKDGRHLRHGAAPSLPDFYNDSIDGMLIFQGAGSCGTAAYTAERVIVPDVMTHPYWVPFRELAERAKIRACWSEPIVSAAGEVLGTFAMYYREPREPEQSELVFIKSAARLAGMAIEQRHTEAELKESEERFRQIAANVGEVFFLSDARDDSAIYISPAFEQIWGLPVETIYTNAQAWQEFVHPDDRQRVKAVLEAHERGKKPFTHEYRIVRNDGAIRWVHDRVIPIKDDTGQVYRIIGVFQDITERKQTEEALKQSEARYQELFDSVMEGIGLVDDKEIVQFCNPAYVQIFEEDKADDLLGKSLLDYIPEDQHQIVTYNISLRKQNVSSQYELDIITGKKNRKTILVSVSPRLDENNNYVGAFGTVVDITERKRSEEEARQHHEALTHVSRLATMGEMASGLAHEINQPLCAIASYTQACVRMLKSGASNRELLLESMEKATVQAQRAGDIVNHIRSFVRKAAPVRSLTNVNHIVRSAADLAEPISKRHRSSICLDLADDLSAVRGDALQLEQVVLNFIINGLEAMDEIEPAKRSLVVHTSRADNGGIAVAVTDHGCGLNSDVREKVFEPFFTTKAKGMGMGLSICRTIIEAHEGRVWASPNPDRGTTFQFVLSAAEGGTDEDE